MNCSRAMTCREWFKNAAATPSTVHHMGLGTCSADRIVEAHGGCIDITSSVEDGMQCTVILPRQCQ